MESVWETRSSWTSSLSPKMRADFIHVVNTVFGNYCSEKYFDLKYCDNPYGESVIVVAYYNGAPIGADALWRNDVLGHKSYQSADTAVIETYRGKGVFTKMVEEKLSKVSDNCVIYGFPNRNSIHGFIKMGWSDEKLYKSLFSWKSYLTEYSLMIDETYAAWWLKAKTGIFCLYRGGCCFLVRKSIKKPICNIIGRVDNKVASMFPRLKGLFIFTYYSKTPSKFINNDSRMTTIQYSKPTIEIPYWKIDAV